MVCLAPTERLLLLTTLLKAYFRAPLVIKKRERYLDVPSISLSPLNHTRFLLSINLHQISSRFDPEKMASTNDLISIKLQLVSENRRLKLPLRELAPSVLPQKVCAAAVIRLFSIETHHADLDIAPSVPGYSRVEECRVRAVLR